IPFQQCLNVLTLWKGKMMLRENYSARMRRASWLAYGLPVLAGLAGSFIIRNVVPGEHFWPVLAALLGLLAIVLWACVPWWKRMDDMQRHGHMFSWFWGGFPGGLAVLLALVAATGVRSEVSLAGLAVLAG